MRNEQDRPGQIDRRRVLTGAGLALGALGAAVAPAVEQAAASPQHEPAGTGYRETDHVRTYYRSARF